MLKLLAVSQNAIGNIFPLSVRRVGFCDFTFLWHWRHIVLLLWIWRLRMWGMPRHMLGLAFSYSPASFTSLFPSVETAKDSKGWVCQLWLIVRGSAEKPLLCHSATVLPSTKTLKVLMASGDIRMSPVWLFVQRRCLTSRHICISSPFLQLFVPAAKRKPSYLWSKSLICHFIV